MKSLAESSGGDGSRIEDTLLIVIPSSNNCLEVTFFLNYLSKLQHYHHDLMLHLQINFTGDVTLSD